MADFIEVSTNEDEVLREFDSYISRHRFRSRELMDDLADTGVQLLRIKAPEYSSYLQRHIDREAVHQTVGASGTELETVVGVKRGTSEHPYYVNFGTGLYATPSRGYITAKQGEYLVFRSDIYGRVIRTKRVKGQRAQNFLYQTWQDLNFYAKARILGSQRA
jgi:hypothetical protein